MHATEGEGDGRQRLSAKCCVSVVKKRRWSRIKSALQRGNGHKGRMKKQKGKVHVDMCVWDREGGQDCSVRARAQRIHSNTHLLSVLHTLLLFTAIMLHWIPTLTSWFIYSAAPSLFYLCVFIFASQIFCLLLHLFWNLIFLSLFC